MDMEITKDDIEFIPEIHAYLVSGVLTPSVSDILKFLFPDKYSNIPAHILNAKAEFGTHIHDAIEKYEQREDVDLTPMEEIVFEQYLDLKEQFEIEPIEQETLVHFEDRFCGRLDMIANVNGVRSLVDIKTTAKLDMESLSWQLSLYRLAYVSKNPKGDFDKFFVIWLPKNDLGRLIEVPQKTMNELFEVLEKYERSMERH